METRPRCPVCRSEDVTPILSGVPTWEAGPAEDRGELVLGGCIPGRARWACRDCGYRFADRPERPRRRIASAAR